MKSIYLPLTVCVSLCLFVSCEQGKKKNSTQNVAVQDVRMEKLQPPSQSAKHESVSEEVKNFAPMKIVQDEEVKPSTVEQKGTAKTNISLDTARNVQYTEEYDRIIENAFVIANQNPLSTFSID